MVEHHTLQTAEAICNDRGSRLTAIRKRVLQLLLQSDKPSKTYDLLAELEKEMPSAKPPTIYRALEFLQAQGLVHKIESQRTYVACSDPHRVACCSYLVCESCRRVTEDGSAELDMQVRQMAQKNSFNLRHQHIELHGVCVRCRETVS